MEISPLTGFMTQPSSLEYTHKSKELVIGIPKEDVKSENRIALAPLDVEILCEMGHKVIIENEAGLAANFEDHEFSERGAQITHHKSEVFAADIVLKIAPPTENEIEMLHNGHAIFSNLSIANQSEEKIRRLMQKKITSISFEHLKDEHHTHPVVRSMSEVSGMASIIVAAEYLSNVTKGKGIVLGGITGIKPTEVIILGAGAASEYAARTALGLRALVKVFDNSLYRLRQLQNDLGQTVHTSVLHPTLLSKALKSADVVIGALKLSEPASTYIVPEEMVEGMKAGSVIVDISMLQGGCFETSKLTTHDAPVFTKHGVVHYCVSNITSRVAHTSSLALSNIFSPIIQRIGESGGVTEYLKENQGIRYGTYIFNGYLTNNQIGNIFGINTKDINLLMAAL